MTDFEKLVNEAAQQSVLKLIRDGNLIAPDYAIRAKIPAAKVQELYDAVDWNRVREIIIGKVEERVADTILNQMATEMATDVKQVLSNKELREEVRSFIRAGIRRAAESA